MRLSTSLIYQNGLNGILNQEAALSRLQEQMSSGKRVLTPADDPLAASLAVNVSQTASMNSTYGSNRNSAAQSLGMEDNALTSVVTTLQDVLKRVVEAGNGTMSDADRQALVSALESSRDQLMGLANSTDGNGQYLFSGYKGQTQPYVKDAAGNITFQGDVGTRTVQVDQSRQIASSDVGPDIFASFSSGTRAYITKADPANGGTATFSSTSVNGPIDPTKTYSLEFTDDGAGNMTYSVVSTPPDAALPTDIPYVSGDKISFDSVSFQVSGAPVDGDVITLAPAARAYTATPDAANTGTGAFSPISITGSVDPAKAYSLQFADDGAGNITYSVTSTPPDPTLPANVPYVAGDKIEFGNMSFSVSGAPADGDSYAIGVANNGNADMFSAMNDLINELKQPSQGDPVASARLVNQIATANKQLTLALDNVLTVRASVGARMNELDALDATGAARGLEYTKQLSGLEDVNIYEATTELLLRKVALDAASSAFSRIEGSSLFSRGR
ncbi:flagellar hook-associated protein 3 [Bordetella genomosp. 1]|uniref:Flagellar hook-associated protein 3 n=1 Tax=Bordetella genomosp. 1 TaxID=1395607 RepID=A0A261S653_9BORD|nr:flagellar hook-associated protein FlgL [Bordetella genomosp. 1]MDQ8032371.1 flagellar hook-associated protein FlgL [Bordetella sp.]OZI32601.1 flagellar hook-associated protein 3 [Bordetella genomosp. 1]OZI66038.1 flagellar hook-associated protein 3 [Bordetella genomosp. 1]